MLQCIGQPGSLLLLDPLSKATFLHHPIACLFVLSSGLRTEQEPASFWEASPSPQQVPLSNYEADRLAVSLDTLNGSGRTLNASRGTFNASLDALNASRDAPNGSRGTPNVAL